MVDVKQEVDVQDYFGPVIVFCLFFVIILSISATCILWFCIGKNEKTDAINKWKGIKKEPEYLKGAKPSSLLYAPRY